MSDEGKTQNMNHREISPPAVGVFRKHLPMVGFATMAVLLVGGAGYSMGSDSSSNGSDSTSVFGVSDVLKYVAEEQGLEHVKSFSAEGEGAQVHLMSAGPNPAVFVTLEGTDYVIQGEALGVDDKGQTYGLVQSVETEIHRAIEQNADAFSPVNATEAAESAYNVMDNDAFYVEQGEGSKVVYVAVDTSCPHCTDYMKSAQAHLEYFTFRWVPVDFGIGGEVSGHNAAMIHSAADNETALELLKEAKYNLDPSQTLPGDPGEDARGSVAELTDSLQAQGVRGTPYSVVKSSEGVVYEMHGNVADELARISEKGL